MKLRVSVRKLRWVAPVALLACGPGYDSLEDAGVSPQYPSAPTASETAGRPAEAVRRLALLVGIDDYSASRLGPPPAAGAPWRRSVPNLEGAVHDVQAMRETLVTLYGFASEDVVTLTDQTATRGAILGALDEHLLQPSREGDLALFYFSGHGSQVKNTLSDEPDHLDETLVPADARLGARDLRDKELGRLFNRLLDKGAHLTVVLDSCHSGSGVRGLLTGARFRSAGLDRRDLLDPSAAGPRPEDRGALVLSGAQDFDLAWETRDERGQAHGAFSLALMRAMRDAAAGESAEEVFLRARARLQAEKRFQEPVLAGTAEARRAPFLGRRAGARAGRTAVAVERVARDGTVVLQGGWAHGLTVGTELRVVESGPGPEVRLEVTSIAGPSRSEARIVPPVPPLPSPLPKPGALAEVTAWAAPPGGPLRVWMPGAAGDFEAAVGLARRLARQAPTRGVKWIEDPTAVAPTHVLRWRTEGWELLDRTGARELLGPAVDAGSVLERVVVQQSTRQPGLFVQLPTPTALVQGLAVGPGTPHDGVEETGRPEAADYVLVGRLDGDDVAYGWLRPEVGEPDRRRTGLPLRTAWYPLGSRDAASGLFEEAAAALEEAVLRLRKIQAWHRLETPAGSAFAYELALRRRGDPRVITGGTLLGGERYNLVLRARREPLPVAVEPRYVYAFVIDSYGKSILLFPTSGSVENRFPLPAPPGTAAPPPPKIPLGRPDRDLFQVTEPYGVDTYFLLASDEPIPNPWVLEWDGVRLRGPEGQTPLEELLSVTGGAMRSATPILVPTTWSLERKLLESVPPAAASPGTRARQGWGGATTAVTRPTSGSASCLVK